MSTCQLIYGILVIFQASHHSFFVSLLVNLFSFKKTNKSSRINEQKLYCADADL